MQRYHAGGVMRIKNYYIILFGVGTILQLINLFVNIKAIWYIGCACVIISVFLPGSFLCIDFKKSSKDHEGKSE